MQNSAICRKIFIQCCSAILLTDEKIYSCHIKKTPEESPTVRNCSNQEERRHYKMIKRSTFRQSLMATVGESQLTRDQENTSLILVDYGVKVIEGCYHNVMML